jgi:hypothetical protein
VFPNVFLGGAIEKIGYEIWYRPRTALHKPTFPGSRRVGADPPSLFRLWFAPVWAERMLADKGMRADTWSLALELLREAGSSEGIWFADCWADGLRSIKPKPRGDLWALSLILQREASRTPRFRLVDDLLAEAGISQRRSRVLLERLEQLGLVAVAWQGRVPPLVAPWHPAAVSS